jgi:hypothetical protein
MPKLQRYFIFLLISTVVALIILLLAILKRFAAIQQVAESAMTSHIYINQIAMRTNEENSALSSKEWIQLMYERKNSFYLNTQTWENLFDYAASKNILVTHEK